MLAVDYHVHADNNGDGAGEHGYNQNGHCNHSPLPKRPRLTIETHTPPGVLPSPPPTALPSPPLSSQPPSMDPVPVNDTPTPESPPSPRTPRVHFRSRVHIASRIPRSRTHANRSRSPPWHNHRLSDGPARPATPPSPGSRPSSPSSSISVPLRPADSDSISTSPLWGPLGRRVHLFATRRLRARAAHDTDPRENQGRDRYVDRYLYHSSGRAYFAARGERTPLIKTVLRPSVYGTRYGKRDWRADLLSSDDERNRYAQEEDDHAERARLSREIDLFFGTWPGRLLNYRWWWWHLEPILCCFCLEETDLE